jgi:hypothetical protein
MAVLERQAAMSNLNRDQEHLMSTTTPQFSPWLCSLVKRIAVLTCALLAVGAQASQQASFTLQATSVVNGAVFRFGTQPFVDGFTPPQTGLASSALLETNGGVRALLNANSLAQAQFRYDASELSPGPGSGVFASFFGPGSDLSIVLPAGTSGTPLSFAKPANAPGLFGLVNGGNLGENISLFTPGPVDAVLFGLATDSFSNSGLTLPNATGFVSKINLLADQQFVATYNGAVPLPELASLTVTLRHGASVRINDPSLQFIDTDGTALNSLGLPASLPTNLFERMSVLLPFDGMLQLSLDPKDFANGSDFAQAQAWVLNSGLQSQVLLRQVAVWEVSPVPEPAAWLLLVAGLGGVLWWRASGQLSGSAKRY